MNKFFALFCALIFASSMQAQTATNALNMSETKVDGSARYMSLGGSMGAIGGDMSAVSDNPAALGIYRSSEFSFGLNFIHTYAESTSPTSIMSEDQNKFRFNSLSLEISASTYQDEGLLFQNFGFSYQKLRDFNRQGSSYAGAQSTSLTDYMARMTSGFSPEGVNTDNYNCPYLSVLGYEGYFINPDTTQAGTPWYSLLSSGETTDQHYSFIESGGIDQYNFSYAQNYNHNIYWGVNLGVTSINYKMDMLYGEAFSGTHTNSELILHNTLAINGTGLNLSGGIIYRPINMLRFGFSFSTPTYYDLTDDYDVDINRPGQRNYYLQNTIDYNLRTPFKMQLSAAAIFGKYGFINIDYQVQDYSNVKLSSDNGTGDIYDKTMYELENGDLSSYGKWSHFIKIGGEYRLDEAFSIRLGYGFKTAISDGNLVQNINSNTAYTIPSYFKDNGTTYQSIGLGYHYNGFSLDLAYLLQKDESEFTSFDDNAELYNNTAYFGVEQSTKNNSTVDYTTLKSNFVATVSFKF